MNTPHEVIPAWSVLYDTYKCAVCNIRAHQDIETREWKHPEWAKPADTFADRMAAKSIEAVQHESWRKKWTD